MPYASLVRAACVVVGLLVLAPSARAVDPWDSRGGEGPYVVEGTGPPNTRVALIRDRAALYFVGEHLPAGSGNGEYTSPQGKFRVDEGTCNFNGNDDCAGGDDTYPFRVVFYDYLNDRVPIWAPNSYFRFGAGESTAFDMPRVENIPRTQRKTFNTSGPASLPSYQTLTGVVNGSSGPLAGVSVNALNAQARGHESLYYAGHDGTGQALSQSDGRWSIKIPPGQWAIRWSTTFHQPFFPYDVWSGCVRDADTVHVTEGTAVPSGTTFHASGSAVDVTFGGSGATSTCNGSAPPTGGGGGSGNPTQPGAPGGSGSGSGASGGGTPSTGGSGAPAGGAGATPASITAPSAAKPKKDGTATLTLTVSGPGKVAASATSASGAKASASAKRKPAVVAKGSATARRAGQVKLLLKPTRAGKKLLKKGRRLKARARITFTPATGTATAISKAVTFKLKSKP